METEEIDISIIKSKNIKNICHIGAHIGNEVEFYVNAGIKKIIWVEANYKILNKLIKKTSVYDVENIYLPLTLSDIDNEILTFNITNNEESSSFMDIGKLHEITYPEIKVIDQVKVVSKRFDAYVNNQNDFKWDEIEMLVVDCQGADLKVLKGFGDLLKSDNLKVIKCEINFGEMYLNNPTEEEIDDYLSKYGFIKSYWFKVYNGTWGNNYWIK